MYRSSADYSTLNDILEVHEDDDHNNNKSFQSNASSNNGTSSSKAVLAALRALQDKIRRLEAERSQALDETAQLRHQLKNQEIEADHIKQKENLTAQKTLQDVRNAYERLLTEKSELEIKLSKLESQNKATQSASEDMLSKIRLLEEEKHSSALRLKDLEHHQQQIEHQTKLAQQKEKEMAQTMVWETKRHEEEVISLQRRVQLQQSDLSHSSQEKGSTDAKLMELDQLVSQLLAVNESLVAQLSGKPIRAASPVKKRTKKSGVKKQTALPRAASAVTVASEAGKTSKFSTRQHSQLIPVKSEDLEQLRVMHKMYSNMAKNIAGGESVSGSAKKKSGGAGGASDSVSVSSARSGSSGRGTRVSQKKAKILEQFHEDAAERLRVSGGVARSQPFSGSMDVRLPRPSFDNHSVNGSADFSQLDSSFDFDRSTRENHSTPLAKNTQANSNNSTFLPPSALKATSSYQGSSSSVGEAAHSRAEMQGVISSLEEEFDALNMQYRRLLSNVEVPLSTGEAARGDDIQAQAEEIVSVIQKLHRKGEQLRSLKSP